MSRLLLMGLDDGDVDVLSLLPGLDPRPEVLVVHSDPAALIMKLADLADLPATTEPPEPDAGDVVVVPGNGDPAAEPVSRWKAMGARIVRPGELTQAMAGTPGPGPTTKAETGRAPEPPRGTISTPRTRKSNMKLNTSTETARTPGQPSGPMTGRPAKTAPAPPDDVWVHPEATFRYLVEVAAGRERAMTLWWDGNTGVWVPWLWTGEIPQGSSEDAESGLEVSDTWGAFRLVGSEDAQSQLNLPALGRVAEDLALRDLAAWRRTAEELADVGYPDPGDEEAVADWAERVITPLRSEAALIWVQDEDSWRLLGTWGEGIVFRGNLVVSESLFRTLFEGEETTWFRWDLPDGVCVQLAMGEEDPRWPLRFHRVRRAMSGESGGW